MMQFPDFDEKQILVIESFDVKFISFQNDNIIIKEDERIKNKLSLYKIFAIFLIGETTLTSVLIRKFQDFGVTIVLMKKNLLPYLVIGNETQGNFVLRKKQYEKTEEEMFAIAKEIVLRKIQNQFLLLKSFRDPDTQTRLAMVQLMKLLEKIPQTHHYDSLLWYEGNASKIFFSHYFKKIWWMKRAPRTKCDVKNLLLDIGYTYLFHFIEALLRLYGFDNYYGVYHRTWYQRKSLALDVMEPFRCIIDKTLLQAYNLKQVNEQDFKFRNGQYILSYEYTQKYSAIFLKAILSHKKEMFYFVKDYYKYFMKWREHFPEFSIISQK